MAIKSVKISLIKIRRKNICHLFHLQQIIKLTLRQENEIAKRTGELITILPGKKEENLMLHLEDNQIMYFRGDDIPCMMIAVKLYNTIDFDAKKKFTEELVKMIKETTNIEINDVYVSFDEYPNWGKQGTLFQ